MLEINFRNYLVEFCGTQDRFVEKVIPETHKNTNGVLITT